MKAWTGSLRLCLPKLEENKCYTACLLYQLAQGSQEEAKDLQVLGSGRAPHIESLRKSRAASLWLNLHFQWERHAHTLKCSLHRVDAPNHDEAYIEA